MKRAFLIICIALAIAAVPAFSQVRFNAALGMAFLPGETGLALIPAAGIHFRIPLDAFKLYAGLRVSPLSMGVSGFPNMVAEYGLGPVILEGQLGGGVLAALSFGDGASFKAGAIFFPDVSVWYPVDTAKAVRLGGGFLGNLNFGKGKYLVVPYLGIKLVVPTP